jgi:hypothetical protein
MDVKKYTLTSVKKVLWCGRNTVHRIQALRSFTCNNWEINEGDLGGFIEWEGNLSHDGNAWVHGNAVVCDNARVHGDAYVCGHAEVCDDAWVYGTSLVSDYGKVYSDAEIHGHVIVSKPIIYVGGLGFGPAVVTDKHLIIGPEIHTIEQWKEDYISICDSHKQLDWIPQIKAILDLAEERL